MASADIVPVLIATATAAQRQALEDPLTRVHEIRIVGADTWEDVQTLRMAIRSFRPELVVATPDFDVPNDLGIPHVRLAMDEDPAAAIKQYLAETAGSSQPVPAPTSAEQPEAPSVRATPAPRLNVPAPQRTVRLGFWGVRGGVGTTTAAIHTATLLGKRGFRVALCDATKRGDTFLWAGFKPQTQPSTSQEWPGVTFFPDLPPAAQLQPFPAIVIDGGRRRRERNVQWVQVTAPLGEEAIARWVDKQC